MQATVVQPPASIIAQKRGMNILADLPKLGLVYQHTAAATTKKYIREHPDIVRRYVKSQLEAVHRIYTDKNAAIRALARFIGQNVDRDVLEKTWENLLNESVLPKKQYPSLEGIKTILATRAQRKARQAGRLRRFELCQRVRSKRLRRRALQETLIELSVLRRKILISCEREEKIPERFLPEFTLSLAKGSK